MSFCFRLNPGYDLDAQKNLVTSDDYALIGLGRYDLILISERPDFSSIYDFRVKSLETIQDIDVISGFKWVPRETKEVQLKKNRPITGLCSIKFDAKSMRSDSVLHEQEAAKKIYEISSRCSVNVCVYGNLGFGTLICIIESSTIEGVSNFVHNIKRSIPHISEITTIPGVNYLYLKENRLDALHEVVKATILMGLLGFNQKIPETCSKRFGTEGREIFGFHDYQIEYEGEIGHLVSGLQYVRKNLSELVHLTHTIVSHKSESFDWLVPKTTFAIANNLKDRIKGVPDGWKNELRDFLFFYNQLEMSLGDSSIQEVFTNQFGLFESLFNLYEKARKQKAGGDLKNYNENMRTFHFTLDCIRMGYLQRFSGIQLGNLLGGKSLNVAGLGLSLRVIRSAEAIPKSLLRKTGLEWNAFCLFSYYGIFFNLPFGVLGYPASTMPRVEEYWGGFHETGHAAYDQLDTKGRLPKSIFRKRNKRIRALLASAIKKYGKDGESLFKNSGLDRSVDHLIMEVFADMYDFRFGFMENWSVYVNTVWKYITDNFPVEIQYVTRMMLVYLIMGPGKNHKKSDIDRFLDESEILLQKLSKKKISEEVMNYSKNNSKQLWDIAHEVAKYLYTFPPCKVPEETLSEIRSYFDKGIPLANIEPSECIVALLIKPIDKTNYVPRFAALMSLYDWAASTYKAETIRFNA